MNKDYYDILGVAKNTSKDEIKKAFYKLAHKYHPDKKEGDENKFKEVNEAYQILSDDGKRAKYDQFGAGFENMNQGYGGHGGFEGFDFGGFSGGFQGGDFGNLNDIFSDFFSGSGMGGGVKQRRGRDISTEIQITLSDSVLGVTRKLAITKTSSCSVCHNSGAKPGTKMDTCKYCNGQGKIREIKRTILGNISNTRICEECLGSGSVPKEKCENCKGKGVLRQEEEVSINVPVGIQNGQTLKMSGYGEAIKNGKTGDLYIKINIKIPTKISKKARELLEELKKEGI